MSRSWPLVLDHRVGLILFALAEWSLKGRFGVSLMLEMSGILAAALGLLHIVLIVRVMFDLLLFVFGGMAGRANSSSALSATVPWQKYGIQIAEDPRIARRYVLVQCLECLTTTSDVCRKRRGVPRTKSFGHDSLPSLLHFETPS